MKPIVVFFCLLTLTSLFQSQSSFANSQAFSNNVSYGSLLKLPKSQPSKIISYGRDPLQFGELWLPNTTNPANPMVVLIHGGCWLKDYDIKHTHAASTALAQAGYIVWSIEYRRTGNTGGGWPGSFDDIKSAIRKAKTLPQFKGKMVLMGHSAGGHLAVLAGQYFNRLRDKSIQKVIGLAPIIDVEQYAKGQNSCQKATPAFFGGPYASYKAYYDSANPMKQGFHPNTVMIHGDQDKIVPISQSKNSKQKFVPVRNAGHFDMLHNKSYAWQQILFTLRSR